MWNRIDYCPSDYQRGDENNPRSPWYEEPPEGWYEDKDDAVLNISVEKDIGYEEAESLVNALGVPGEGGGIFVDPELVWADE